MSKQLIHIYIEPAIYLALKSKKINLSEVGNNLFKNYVEVENISTEQEESIVEELTNITKQKKLFDDRFALLSVQLTHIREQKEKEAKQKDKEDENMMQALRINNPLRYANLGQGGKKE